MWNPLWIYKQCFRIAIMKSASLPLPRIPNGHAWCNGWSFLIKYSGELDILKITSWY